MRDTFLDVRLELDLEALNREPDPSRYVIEALRQEADALCERTRSPLGQRARLRTDRAPEIIVEKGQNRITGQLCLLVAARWACVTPDDVPMGPPRA